MRHHSSPHFCTSRLEPCGITVITSNASPGPERRLTLFTTVAGSAAIRVAENIRIAKAKIAVFGENTLRSGLRCRPAPDSNNTSSRSGWALRHEAAPAALVKEETRRAPYDRENRLGLSEEVHSPRPMCIEIPQRGRRIALIWAQHRAPALTKERCH
jgi:hypothetical protein